MTGLPEPSDLAETTARLVARVEALERRVNALERWPAARAADAALVSEIPHCELETAATDSFSAAAVFSVLGRAMLGIAGAYVLRAGAQANLLPRPVAAAFAIPYALAWLVWAARAATWFASAAYAATSALILAPMLWELTLRFNVLPPWAAAMVLAAFAGAATALAWRRRLASVYWVANVAAVLVAFSLALVSRALEPFALVFLALAALAEFATMREREPGVRAFVNLAADAILWAAIYVYVSPASTRADYPILGAGALIAPGFVLFAIFAAGVLYRTAIRGKPITVFETAQTMIAFSLAACGLACFGPQNASAILGYICLGLAAAAYGTTFIVFDGARLPRNYRVFAVWSLALFLSGSVLALPQGWLAPWLAAAAVAATWLGARFKRVALEFDGAACLVAASAASGLAAYIGRALAGSLPRAPGWSVTLVFASAVLCYGVLQPRKKGSGEDGSEAESWGREALNLFFAALAVVGAAALAVRGLMALAALGIEPGTHHLAFFRTLTACAAALGLAYSGARWGRRELTRIGYAALALIAVKLVAEDLRHGHLEYIAGSIFLYALTLIGFPRVARLGQRA